MGVRRVPVRRRPAHRPAVPPPGARSRGPRRRRGQTPVVLRTQRTTTLAGWTRLEVLVLIGTFELLSGVKTTFVDPNLAGFPTRGVREGRLDHHLLQPAPSMFLVSFATAAPLAAVQILLGLGVVSPARASCRSSRVPVRSWGGPCSWPPRR
ncbi:ABC-2 family transporter protein [Amycolatopsis sp. NPDC049253]|uniref:ABC-2 family transporter protein n=1 Tax=Amycolatopsis sp. NPDC049253 TaxID=3155274 RepID=UPI00342BAF4D